MENVIYRSAEAVNSAMLRVYNQMCMAVIVSGIVSMAVSSSPALMQFLFTGVMKWIVIFAPLGMSLLLGFMFIGLIAIIIASVLNSFIVSTAMTMMISALAIIIFLGLTAYDTQQIREMVSVENPEGNAEIAGALTLYMDFINLFLNLLQLFGDKKE
jgi:FtsH-binding integral membrane protein